MLGYLAIVLKVKSMIYRQIAHSETTFMHGIVQQP